MSKRAFVVALLIMMVVLSICSYACGCLYVITKSEAWTSHDNQVVVMSIFGHEFHYLTTAK